MDAAAELETAFFVDHLVPVVLILALAMQWLLHQVTARMARFHLLLPGVTTSIIWAVAGWMIGGIGGVLTFALGTSASLGLAVLDERMRRARDDTRPEDGVRFG